MIGADTLVILEGTVFGKPKDMVEAEEMLRQLSGRTHSVFTGFAIIFGSHEVSEAVETKVTFRELSGDEIRAYLAKSHILDHAGSYGVEGLGALLVENIEGDHYNVVGLPLSRVATRLREFGVNLLAR